MNKQKFNGVPIGVLHLSIAGNGWRYSDVSVGQLAPVYTYWTGTGSFKSATLWWSGARWVAWGDGVFVMQATEFMDINDPPTEWAEGIYILANKQER